MNSCRFFICSADFILQDSCDDVSSTPSTLSPVMSNEVVEGDDPPPSTAEGDTTQLSAKLCKMIMKSVCGRVLTREERAKLLKKRFSVTPKNSISIVGSGLQEANKAQVCGDP